MSERARLAASRGPRGEGPVKGRRVSARGGASRWGLRGVVAAVLFGLLTVVYAPAAGAATCVSRDSLTAEQQASWDALGLGSVCVSQAPGQSATDALTAFLNTPGPIQSGYVVPGASPVTLGRIPAAIGGITGTISTVARPAINWGQGLVTGLTLLAGGLAAWVFNADRGDPATVWPTTLPATTPSVTLNCQQDNYSGWVNVAGGCNYLITVQGIGTATGGGATITMHPNGFYNATNGIYSGVSYQGFCSNGTTQQSAGFGGGLGPMPADTPWKWGSATGRAGANCAYWGAGYVFTGFRVWEGATGLTVQSMPTDQPVTRTIEQTVTCKRPDGSTHTVTNSTTIPSSAGQGAQVPVAGLMCPTGEVATQALVERTTTPQGGSTTRETISTPAGAGAATGSAPGAITSPGWVQSLPTTCLTSSGCTLTTVDQPGTSVSPSPSTSVSATAAPPVATEPKVTDPDASKSNTPSSSFCGIEWRDLINGLIVFKAVGCALSWAFKPDPANLQAKVQSVRSTWSSSSVGTFITSAAGVPMAFGSWADSGSCTGPTFSVPLPGKTQDVQPLNACNAPMSTVAMWVKVISTAVVVIGGVAFVAYPVLRAFGMPQIGRRDDGD